MQTKLSMNYFYSDTDSGKTVVFGEKTCASITLCTSNLTCTSLRQNPRLRREKRIINHLSHGTA